MRVPFGDDGGAMHREVEIGAAHQAARPGERDHRRIDDQLGIFGSHLPETLRRPRRLSHAMREIIDEVAEFVQLASVDRRQNLGNCTHR